MSFDRSALRRDLTELYPDGIPPAVVSSLHRESLDELDRLGRAEVRFFVVGNYDEPQKTRLETVRRLLSEPAPDEAFTLEEIDPEVDVWENFYVKFRVFLLRADHLVGVFEDNDGGHELEIGETPLSSVSVLKRSYASVSIENDVEYEKYDAMLGTLFDLLDRRNRLYEWEDESDLIVATKRLSTDLGNGTPPDP